MFCEFSTNSFSQEDECGSSSVKWAQIKLASYFGANSNFISSFSES